MNLTLVIYLIDLAGSVSALAGAVVFLSVFAAVLLVVFIAVELDGDFSRLPTFLKRAPRMLIGAIVVFTVLWTAIPDKSTSYAMLAAYGGQSLIESDAAKRIAPKSLELIERTIDKHLKEME